MFERIHRDTSAKKDPEGRENEEKAEKKQAAEQYSDGDESYNDFA